jgi:uncharacterized glyoxalase superfamily protein PhnB
VAWAREEQKHSHSCPPSPNLSWLMFRDAFTILDTADVARLSAFYVDQLGFRPGYRWPDQEEPTFRVVSLDAFSIGLSKTDALPASGRAAFLALHRRIDHEIERLRAGGVAVVAEPANTEWGERMATISDLMGISCILGSAFRTDLRLQHGSFGVHRRRPPSKRPALTVQAAQANALPAFVPNAT